MKQIHFLMQLIVGLFAFSFMSMAQAGGPLWTFTPVDGYPSALTISKTGTATVKYTVTNQTSKKRTLMMQPQVGISQTQPCIVGPKGSASSSCTLALTISGSLLPPSGVSGGPNLCQANPNGTPNPNLCYQPSPANILNVKVTSEASLVSIDVTPVNPAIAQGLTQQFTATGIYSDNTSKDLTSSVTWSSSNTNIAVISSTTGLAEGIAQGTVTITATSGAIAGTTNLTVSTAKLKSIVVKPTNPQIAQGTTQQFIAVGVFTDGSTHNITSSVVWSSSNTTVALISNRLGNNGLAAGRTAGATTITATLGTISGTTTLTVTNAVLQSIFVSPVNRTIAQGITQQYSATGIFSDNSTQDLTSSVNWSSSNTDIATINNTGKATSIAQGKVLIRATSGSVFGTTSLTVTAATLKSIAVTPANASIAKGTTQQFIATGTFTDGSKSDITSSVFWSSSQPEFATISNEAGSNGLATGESAGQTNIVATLGTISGSTPFTVTTATLVSISVSPANKTIANGVTQPYTATGIFSDNSTQDLTYSASLIWSTSAPTVATINSIGQATGVGPGTATVTATYGALSGTANLTVTAATLQSIAVTPASAMIPQGATQQFIATGTFSNGSTYDITSSVTWSSGDESVVVFSEPGLNGLATGKNRGSTTVKATLGTVSSPTVNATVTDATLVSINVDPVIKSIPQGLTQQFTATGVYSDGSSRPLTSSVHWSSSTSAASISNELGSQGLATGDSTGTTTITATYSDASSTVSGTATLTVTNATLQSIAVTPASATIPLGTTQQFIATGTFTDGTTHDLTSTVTWDSSTPGVATISNNLGSYGLATAGMSQTGSTTIKATLGSLSGSATLNVSGVVLQSISITPAAVAIPKSTNQAFVATGIYSDGSSKIITDVTWSTSDASIATIDSVGVAQSKNIQGSVTITAISGTVSGTATLSVTAATLQSIAVTPVNPSIAKGTTKQFIATGTYTDGTTQDITSSVTWDSSSSSVATISNDPGSKGLALASTTPTGTTTTITATLNGVSDSTTLTVTTAVLTSIDVTPAATAIPQGTSQPYTARGIYSDGTLQVITDVTWSTSDSSIATINSAGVAQSKNRQASVTITATSGTISGNATLTVTAATLQSIAVTPANPSIAKGTTKQFIATGTFTDSTTHDITSSVTWDSSSSSVATISNDPGSKGLATASTTPTGTTTTIKATLNGVSGSTTLTVTTAVLTSINVTPATVAIPEGTNQTFVATGVYSDGTSQTITNVTWSTSDSS
ncbi:beta strand repeat-containing protein, partial [Legionella cincinnatiensis]